MQKNKKEVEEMKMKIWQKNNTRETQKKNALTKDRRTKKNRFLFKPTGFFWFFLTEKSPVYKPKKTAV